MPLLTILAWIAGALILVAAFTIGYFVFATRKIAANAENRVPASGKFVMVDGNRLHYVERGRGRPILFLHGLGGQLHHFRQPLFAALEADFRVIAVDRPGSGYSSRAAGATGRLTEQALVMRHFIEKLGAERPLVVGHSLGGAVALALALDHPDAISGLALLSPVTHMAEAVPPEFKALYIRSAALRKFISHTIAVPAALKHAPQTLAFVFGPQQPPQNYAVEGGGLAGLRPSHFYATATDLVAIQHDLGRLEARYDEIKVPVGILFGAADRVLDHEVHGAAMSARIPGLEIEIVEGLGHMPQFAATNRVLAFIRRMADKAFGNTQV